MIDSPCFFHLSQDAPRLNGTLSVSRGFGDFDLQPCLSPEPYVNIVPISPDDRFVLPLPPLPSSCHAALRRGRSCANKPS